MGTTISTNGLRKKKTASRKPQEHFRETPTNVYSVAGKKRLLRHTTETWADSNFHGAVSGIEFVFLLSIVG